MPTINGHPLSRRELNVVSRLRGRTTYANVVATLALIVAVGGSSAYALQGRNTVFSDDIAPNEVGPKDVNERRLKIPRLVVLGAGPESTAPGQQLTAKAECPPGYNVVGGGFDLDHIAGTVPVEVNRPDAKLGPSGFTYPRWKVVAESTAEGEWVEAWAVCQRGITTDPE
jgi:hypothetical protein